MKSKKIQRDWNYFKKYEGKCWICGAVTDSNEHAFKKSDIEESFGKPPYNKETAPRYIIGGNKERIVQGPKSQLLTYKKVLCKYCNNTRTRPFDLAYQAFVSYLWRNEQEILQSKKLDLAEIFGEDGYAQSLDLFRYFMKSVGSRL